MGIYEVHQQEFRTPRGSMVSLLLRNDSSDYNTLNSCLNEDEYRLRELRLTGTALDVGAHIGGVTVALLKDNPELRVVAVEAVPPNADLLRQNIERNGLSERATVLEAAASKGRTATIRWAFAGNETADHHAFIGNAALPQTIEAVHLNEVVPVRSLASIVKEFGPLSFCKIDCEMCEFDFLRGKALAQVALIRGEVHADPAPLVAALIDTHHVTTTGPIPAAFEAVLR